MTRRNKTGYRECGLSVAFWSNFVYVWNDTYARPIKILLTPYMTPLIMVKEVIESEVDIDDAE